MKLSIAVSTPDAKFSALALKGSFEENFEIVKKAGFEGVEISVRDPKVVDQDLLKTLLDQFDFDVPALATGRAFGEEGLCFSSPDEAVRCAAVQRVKDQINFAGRIKSNVIIGLILGKNERNNINEQWAIECCRECAVHAKKMNLHLFLEPINRYETSFLITVEDVLNFIETVGVDETTCRVLLDTFHMNIEESSIEGSIRRAGARIGHVHIADSNRKHPGAGHMDFKSIVSVLKESGYDGFLSAEILPLPDPVSAAFNTVEHMRNIVGI
jgi:5-keto-L-gluconate epimerase